MVFKSSTSLLDCIYTFFQLLKEVLKTVIEDLFLLSFSSVSFVSCILKLSYQVYILKYMHV